MLSGATAELCLCACECYTVDGFPGCGNVCFLRRWVTLGEVGSGLWACYWLVRDRLGWASGIGLGIGFGCADVVVALVVGCPRE